MKLKINDQIPDTDIYQLVNGEPQKNKIREILGEKKIILFGLPGAFTSTCSKFHLPGFIANASKIKAKGIKDIFCLSVNDPYVMDAWAKISKVESEIIMLADPFGDFANKLGVLVNKDAKGLGMRSSRYTMIIENKVIKYIAVEKETGICELSAADNVLSKL